ncbi:MAG: DinB family protein [Candidatus Hydrogenedentes bacterium]|nr:DinB family protein [Candidatus Hydrogenedentota bacterium]
MSSTLATGLVTQLNLVKEYFDRSTKVLDEGDSSFSPKDGMMTVAQQVAHVAQTIDWFREGIVRPEGFDMNFEAHWNEVAKVASLKAAREWHQRAHDAMVQQVARTSDAELNAPLPAGPVMGGAPKSSVVGGIDDHTAHHRGALTVYTRLIGKVAAMPYMDV